jgi:hypothetical protein
LFSALFVSDCRKRVPRAHDETARSKLRREWSQRRRTTKEGLALVASGEKPSADVCAFAGSVRMRLPEAAKAYLANGEFAFSFGGRLLGVSFAREQHEESAAK